MAKLNVNGRSVDIRAAASTPLLWALRDELGLTGTKYGCGIGACGACTVLLDGKAVRSCGLLLGEIAPVQKIVTIEGLSPDAAHLVQKAWAALDVPQCGYCQSGMILAAVALLRETRHPTDAEIDAAMTNICRCGTYQRVRAAIHAAAGVPAKPPAKSP